MKKELIKSNQHTKFTPVAKFFLVSAVFFWILIAVSYSHYQLTPLLQILVRPLVVTYNALLDIFGPLTTLMPIIFLILFLSCITVKNIDIKKVVLKTFSIYLLLILVHHAVMVSQTDYRSGIISSAYFSFFTSVFGKYAGLIVSIACLVIIALKLLNIKIDFYKYLATSYSYILKLFQSKKSSLLNTSYPTLHEDQTNVLNIQSQEAKQNAQNFSITVKIQPNTLNSDVIHNVKVEETHHSQSIKDENEVSESEGETSTIVTHETNAEKVNDENPHNDLSNQHDIYIDENTVVDEVSDEEKLTMPLDINLLQDAESNNIEPIDKKILNQFQNSIIETSKYKASLILIPSKNNAILQGLSTVVFNFYTPKKQSVHVSRLQNIKKDLGLALCRQPVDVIIGEEIKVVVPLNSSERTFVPIKPLLLETYDKNETNSVNGLIGRKDNGEPFTIDFNNDPHWLVAGTTGSGKSMCLTTIIFGIIFRYSPNKVKLCIADYKQEFRHFENLPHLFHPVAYSQSDYQYLLEALQQELTRRKNNSNAKRWRNQDKIIVIIDEFHGFGSSDELMSLVAECRAFGIHFIISTQHPLAKVIDTTIKANLPTRICFKVSDSSASRLILGQSGATNLLGKGDCWVRTMSSIDRIQAGLVTTDVDDENSDITKLINHLDN
ncbi:MAG: hypothetical protein KDA87_15435 [Planctomycetales bacterium]|nr:hypothetical protein [Planctomycetales bacterium]